MQGQRRLAASQAALQPLPQRHIQRRGDRRIALLCRQQRPGPQPQLPQPVADREGKARIAQVMEQLAAHLGHHVARRSMAAAGLKTQGRLAQPLIGRSEQVVVVEAVADGKAAGLLLRQRQVADGKAALLRAEWPARRPAATGAPSRRCSPGGTGPARAAADRAAAGRWLQP